jgi:hypothetical protein
MSIPANKTNKRVIEKLTKNRSNLTRVRSRELKKTNYRTKTRLIPSESRSRSTTIITKAIKRGGLLTDSEREIERGQSTQKLPRERSRKWKRGRLHISTCALIWVW